MQMVLSYLHGEGVHANDTLLFTILLLIYLRFTYMQMRFEMKLYTGICMQLAGRGPTPKQCWATPS